MANIYMIRLHKADQREHLFHLSDLHLLVLMIHRAVCKPCGHCCRFFFRFHTRHRVSCSLHTLNSVLCYPLSQLSFLTRARL